MSRLKLLFSPLLFTLLAACGQERPPTAAEQLAALQGQWVVVNYWAQWCKPCIEEIPELNALDAAHDDIAVLGVNYDGATGEALASQIEALGVAFPTLPSDPAELLGQPRPSVLPTTFILNPEGELLASLVGPQTQETLLAHVREAPGVQ